MRRLLIALIFVAGLHSRAHGQLHITNDTTTIRLLLQQSDDYYLHRYDKAGLDSALLLAQQAATIAATLNDAAGIGNSDMAISKALSKAQQRDKAKPYVAHAIKVFADARLFTGLGFAYWEMSGYISQQQYPEKMRYIQKSVAAFHAAGNIRKEADALRELADARQIYGDYAQALVELKQALKLYQSINAEDLERTYDLMGDVSCSLGILNDAVQYGLLAIQAAEKAKDTSLQLCTVYNHLGITYYYLSDYATSADYYKKALTVAEKYRSYGDIYFIGFNYGNNLIRQRKLVECNAHLKNILRKYPTADTPYLVLYTASFLSNYSALKDLQKAQWEFNRLQQLKKGRALENDIARSVYSSEIDYLLSTKQYAAARQRLVANEKFLSENSTLIQLAVNQISWIRLDSAIGDYRDGVKHYHQYAILKDSIFNKEKTRHIAQMNVLYETNKKDQDILLKEKNIEVLNQKAKVQSSELARANQTRNWILGVILLLIIITGLLINYSRLKQRTNRQLRVQQKEIEKNNASLQKLVAEKEWLVKEIHHRVKNNFQIVQGLLGTQSGYLKSEEAVNALSDSQHRVQAMSLIHQKLYQTEKLSAINMAEYIPELVSYLRDSFNIKPVIQFNLQIAPVELDIAHSIPLGLLLNEAVTNAIKYAFHGNRAGIITIALKRNRDHELVLLIKDNGIGLPANFNHGDVSSMGMRLMHGLTGDMDGRLSIHSNGGTEIQVTFPYDFSASDAPYSTTADLTSSI